jgi:hypothetical protein
VNLAAMCSGQRKFIGVSTVRGRSLTGTATP